MNQIIGQQTEALACAYLKKQGLVFIERNFRSRCGEIDLIMRDKQHLIFVEVRYRQQSQFGGAIESIDWHKQQRIIRTAERYLQEKQWASELDSRFDVVTLSGNVATPSIAWIKNAFELS